MVLWLCVPRGLQAKASVVVGTQKPASWLMKKHVLRENLRLRGCIMWLNAAGRKAVGREEHPLMALCENVPSKVAGSLQDKSTLGLYLTEANELATLWLQQVHALPKAIS